MPLTFLGVSEPVREVEDGQTLEVNHLNVKKDRIVPTIHGENVIEATDTVKPTNVRER